MLGLLRRRVKPVRAGGKVKSVDVTINNGIAKAMLVLGNNQVRAIDSSL